MKPWAIALLTLLADQASKWAVQASLIPAQSMPLIPSVLHLTYVQNTGMAFGLFRGHPYVFVVLAVVIAAVIIRELVGVDRPWWMRVVLALILGGATGNLIDRVRVGYVIDFIDLRVWPVFNIADSAITVGVAILVWQSLFPRNSSASHPK